MLLVQILEIMHWAFIFHHDVQTIQTVKGYYFNFNALV